MASLGNGWLHCADFKFAVHSPAQEIRLVASLLPHPVSETLTPTASSPQALALMSHNQKLYKFTARLCNEKGTKGEASFHALTKTVGNGLVQALDNITHKPEAANPHAFNASFGEVKEARKVCTLLIGLRSDAKDLLISFPGSSSLDVPSKLETPSSLHATSRGQRMTRQRHPRS